MSRSLAQVYFELYYNIKRSLNKVYFYVCMQPLESISLHKNFILPLVIGVIFGIFFTLMFLNTPINTKIQMLCSTSPNTHPEIDVLSLENLQNKIPQPSQNSRELADKLAKEIKIVCWILTMPSNHEKRCKHVKATWGRRCNVLVFMSSQEDKNLPAVNLNISHEGRDILWEKTKLAFKYVYENYRDQGDWFVKADDDTYMIIENLRYMLQPYNSSHPLYFGSRYKTIVKPQGYMAGGAGYVLSKEALQRFVTKGITDETGKICRKDGKGAEDAEMGKCMQNLNVPAGDTRDALGRGRFLPLAPNYHLIPKIMDKKFWLWTSSYYKFEVGENCCSDIAISFHYVQPNQMHEMEYFIYHLVPYGINTIPLIEQYKGLNYPPSSISSENSKITGLV